MVPGRSAVVTHVDQITDKRANLRPTTDDPATAKAAVRRAALTRIAALEAGQPRAVRDFILNGDKTKIAALDAAVAELRADL
jgi:hypothetical protein